MVGSENRYQVLMFKDILDKFILTVGVGTVTIPKKMYGEDFDLF